jgi:biotin carboxyl carrier protein
VSDVVPAIALVYREANDRRHRFRFSGPARVRVGERTYEAVNWAPGGIAIRRIAGAPAPGERFRCEVDLPGAAAALRLTCEVRHCDPSRDVAGCEFVELGEAEREALAALYAARIADLKPAGSPASGQVFGRDAHLPPRARAAPRGARRTIVLLAATAALLAILFPARAGMDDWLARRASPSGRGAGPAVVVRAPLAGFALGPALKSGARVSAGDVLFQILDEAPERRSERSGPASAADSRLVRAPADAEVAEALVSSGERVAAGRALCVLRPSRDAPGR